MSFQIVPLAYAPFARLFEADLDTLRHHHARLVVADADTGFPCRVSLADAPKGSRLVLVNYEHLAADGPYRARHAIYVREGAIEAQPETGEIPHAIHRRQISIRAFDDTSQMVDACVATGDGIADAVTAFLADASVSFVHLHNAGPGCFMASAARCA